MPKPITVSYSELDTFRQCPLKHALAYKQRWTQPVIEGGALSRGAAWHAILETHYRTLKSAQQETDAGYPDPVLPLPAGMSHYGDILSGPALIDRCAAAINDAGLLCDRDTGQQTEQQALLLWMYHGHLARWGVDPDWEILAVEQAFTYPLPTPTGRRSHFHLKGKIDLIVRDRTTGRVWLVDHKTGRDISRRSEIDIDDQFGLYIWALRRSGKQVFGAIRSDARTQRNKGPMPLDTRFARQTMYRTEVEVANIAADAYRTARAAYHAVNDQPYSAPNPQQCAWKCGFKEAHILMRKGLPPVPVLKDQGFHQDYRRH